MTCQIVTTRKINKEKKLFHGAEQVQIQMHTSNALLHWFEIVRSYNGTKDFYLGKINFFISDYCSLHPSIFVIWPWFTSSIHI